MTAGLESGLNNKLAKVEPTNGGRVERVVPGDVVGPGWDNPKAGPKTNGVEDSKLAGVESSKVLAGSWGLKGTGPLGSDSPDAPIL